MGEGERFIASPRPSPCRPRWRVVRGARHPRGGAGTGHPPAPDGSHAPRVGTPALASGQPPLRVSARRPGRARPATQGSLRVARGAGVGGRASAGPPRRAKSVLVSGRVRGRFSASSERSLSWASATCPIWSSTRASASFRLPCPLLLCSPPGAWNRCVQQGLTAHPLAIAHFSCGQARVLHFDDIAPAIRSRAIDVRHVIDAGQVRAREHLPGILTPSRGIG